MQKALVLGAGSSGVSAAEFLLAKHYKVSLFDQNLALLKSDRGVLALKDKGVQIVETEAFILPFSFDLVVASPGFLVTENWRSKGRELIGEIELGARFLKNKAIAITGTNGKTTVTLLLEHVLNHASIPAAAVGNVGTPLTSHLLKAYDENTVLVMELSSYQLETLSSKVFDAAVILNITPDHLDRYPTMQEYATAKINLKNCLKENSPLYADEATFHHFKELFGDSKCSFFGFSKEADLYSDLENVYLKEKFEYTLPCALRGKKSHDLENMMAAYALAKEFNVSAKQFLEAFSLFKKPAHRIEFVREHQSVCYYDDSKGTNIAAVLKAVDFLKGPLYLIAGGVDKGSSYAPWKEAFKGKVQAVFLIGQAAKKIEAEIGQDVATYFVATLEEAVKKAAEMAKAGDSVLLSPGCSSYDMFKDYKARGSEFKRVVNSL
ncbi:MAG TPA: UDP-N-acetylmuramoyl-L-alanine--D-glutamate ligase [Parachlamydiaceae bacterium]|nr:UDP-N-acetylmuramoyl-L-alanine--D-glutamate ligase [Parachlamydiaceae bacterium]